MVASLCLRGHTNRQRLGIQTAYNCFARSLNAPKPPSQRQGGAIAFGLLGVGAHSDPQRRNSVEHFRDEKLSLRLRHVLGYDGFINPQTKRCLEVAKYLFLDHDREGVVVRESKTKSTAEAIAGELSKAPTCHRIVFETGRMAPILFHGLNQLDLPVVCVESRQAYQALKSLATHKTDRNDARGLAHLARTGFFKPVHVKSLQAHALLSLISARKKLVGQRVTLENQIRGLAVVFGVRLPRALTTALVDRALKASEGIAGLSAAMRGLSAARAAVMTAVAAIDADIRRMTRASAACQRLMTIQGVGQLTALAFVAAIDDPSRIRRSRDIGAYLGLVPRRYQSGEVDYVGSISKCGDRRVRTLLYEAANVMLTRYKGQLKLKDWAFAIAKRSTMRKARVALARRLAIIMHAMLRDGTEFEFA